MYNTPPIYCRAPPIYCHAPPTRGINATGQSCLTSDLVELSLKKKFGEEEEEEEGSKVILAVILRLLVRFHQWGAAWK